MIFDKEGFKIITFGTIVIILYILCIIGGWIYLFIKLGFNGILKMIKNADDEPWVMWF